MHQLCQPEVEDLDPSVLRHKEVLRLQIPMDDPLLVRRGEPTSDLDRVIESLARREAGHGEPFAQRLPFEELGNDVRRPLVLAELVNREDAGMIETRRGSSLLFETSQPVGVL
jgi:hypothetical protein